MKTLPEEQRLQTGLGVHILLLFVHQNKYCVVVLNVKLVCLFPSQEDFQKQKVCFVIIVCPN